MSISRLRKTLYARALLAAGARQLAACLVGLGAAASLIVFTFVNRHNQDEQLVSHRNTFQSIVEDIGTQFDRCAYGLRGLSNFARVESMAKMTRRRFEEFVNGNDAGQESIGSRGIGLIRYVRQDDVDRFLREKSALDGDPDFRIKQFSSHDGMRYVIQYVTATELNAEALGLDISSEPVRAAGAISAVERNRPTLTGPIRLVQSGTDRPNGLLMLLPIFKNNAPIATTEQRFEALEGWAYAPFVMHDVLADIFVRYSGWHVRIVDDTDRATPLYDTIGDAKDLSPAIERTIQIAGRSWHITGASVPAGMTARGTLEPFLAASVTFLLFSLIACAVYVNTRHLARQQQLSTERSQLADIVAHAADAMLSTDMSGRIQSWNAAASRLFRMSEAEAQGTDVQCLLAEQLQPIFTSLSAGRELPENGINMNTMCIARGGTRFPATVSIFALGSSTGHLGISVRDMSEQQSFEACILELTHKLQAEVNERTLQLNQSLALQAEIHHLAMHDPLTGLANRTLFRERLQAAVALHARNPDQASALLALDLDRFKPVNDTYGHPIGDILLVQIGQRLRACLASQETAARLGGDEFAILLGPGTTGDQALATAQRLLAAIEKPFYVEDLVLEIGVSIGVALLDETAIHANADDFFKLADHALYMAKRKGRGCYHVCSGLQDAEGPQTSRLSIEIRDALRRGEFHLMYQPIIDCAMGRLDGFEALLRWQHPIRGTISPSEFIPIAEEIDQIVAIGEWALRTACQEAATWSKDITVSVNVSPVQIKRAGWDDSVLATLTETRLEPSRLIIEVTESVLMTDSALVLASLKRLQDNGVSIALDDFGTGYSSLSYLRRFRFDKLKIDKSFMRDAKDVVCAAIIRCIVRLGRQLSMSVVAEGIETEQQLRLVEREGCTHAQGYFFAKPMPAVAVPGYIENMRQPQSSGLRQPRSTGVRKSA